MDQEKQNLLDNIISLIQEIRNHSNDGGTIIVEGRNDRKALKILGIQEGILEIYENRKPLIRLEHLIKNRSRVLILTDFDQEGIELAKRLENLLAARNPRFLTTLRNNLRDLIIPWIRMVEELPNLIEKIQSQIGS